MGVTVATPEQIVGLDAQIELLGQMQVRMAEHDAVPPEPERRCQFCAGQHRDRGLYRCQRCSHAFCVLSLAGELYRGKMVGHVISVSTRETMLAHSKRTDAGQWPVEGAAGDVVWVCGPVFRESDDAYGPQVVAEEQRAAETAALEKMTRHQYACGLEALHATDPPPGGLGS
jgi:hypothetical protein